MRTRSFPLGGAFLAVAIAILLEALLAQSFAALLVGALEIAIHTPAVDTRDPYLHKTHIALGMSMACAVPRSLLMPHTRSRERRGFDAEACVNLGQIQSNTDRHRTNHGNMTNALREPRHIDDVSKPRWRQEEDRGCRIAVPLVWHRLASRTG